MFFVPFTVLFVARKNETQRGLIVRLPILLVTNFSYYPVFDSQITIFKFHSNIPYPTHCAFRYSQKYNFPYIYITQWPDNKITYATCCTPCIAL